MKAWSNKGSTFRAVISLLCTFPLVGHAGVIERSSKPFVLSPNVQFVIASEPKTPPAVAPPAVIPAPVAPAPVPLRVFELRREDGTVKNAFLRWAEATGTQVNWQVQSELPLDAWARIEAATVAEAMTEVAKAFATRGQPFVIREYDNTIVVLPRLVARP